MPCVFLSHSSFDKALARRIADDLRRAEIEVWFDEWNIVAGESIPAKIQEGLQRADFLAIVLSRHSVQSGWVAKEWETQIWREAQRKRVSIIPVLADDCPIPTLLQHKKHADFSQDYRRGLQDLLTAIRRLSGPAAAPPLVEPRYLTHHNFLCYAADGAEIALHLYERCQQAGIGVWLDQRDVLESGPPWEQQALEALQTCHALLLVLTRQSAADCAECAREWKRALSYKKPILVLEAQPDLDLPFELEGRQRISLFGSEEKALETLRQRLDWLDTPTGRLHSLKERLGDAQRALRRSRRGRQTRAAPVRRPGRC